MLKSEDNSNINSDFLLPQGGQLVSILSSYNVKDSDLYLLLRRKGIYIGARDRKQMIMLLASTLITPNDFDYLIKRISDREEKYRTTEASVQCHEDAEAIESIITEEYVRQLMDSSSDKYPMFSVKDVGYERYNNRIEIRGKVETHDWIQNVQATSRLHEFSFEIENKGSIINYTSGTTTIETKRLIEHIREEINKTLKNNGIVSRRSKIFILRNDYFTNQISMFEFFKHFEEDKYSILKFNKIIDIVFGMYEFANVPSEFKWMKEKIEEISLKGDGIESNDIIRLGKSGCLNFGEIESEFSFLFEKTSGTCVIKYGFPAGHKKTKKGNSRSIEFEARVVSIEVAEKNVLIKKAIVADFNARKAFVCNEMSKAGKLKNEIDRQGEIL